MSLEIFVVFHKTLFDECYAELTDEEFDCLTFVAVNESIPKVYDTAKYKKLINEWELPVYDPYYQKNGYNENSVLKHLYENDRVVTDYVGLAQYDMKFPAESISLIRKNLRPDLCISTLLLDYGTAFQASYACSSKESCIGRIQDYYSAFAGIPPTTHDFYPLLNSYIIHRDVYNRAMKFAKYMFTVFSPSDGNMGGIFERVFAYAVRNSVVSVAYGPIQDLNTKLKPLCY